MLSSNPDIQFSQTNIACQLLANIVYNVDKYMNYETLNLSVHIENLYVTASFKVTYVTPPFLKKPSPLASP
jgi:hypothetical protein